jgi:hypothetical protein
MFWMIMAAVGGAVAVFLAMRDNYEMAFVAAAVGAVCWFLSYRQQLSASLPPEDDEQTNEDEESDEEVRS